MQMLKYLLLTLLFAGVIGAVSGVLIGKYLVKKEKSESKPLLKKKERYIYLGAVAFGMLCICFGLFFQFPASQTVAVDSPPVTDGSNVLRGSTDGNAKPVMDGAVIPDGNAAGSSAAAKDDEFIEESEPAEEGTTERDGETVRDGDTAGASESTADSESAASSESTASSGSSASSRITAGDLLRRNRENAGAD